MIDLSRWAPSLTAFAKWVHGQSATSAKLWERRLTAVDLPTIEGAIAEAVVWDCLACQCDSSRLSDAAGTGGPDFTFSSGNAIFMVEVTNISSEAAERESGLSDSTPTSGFYGLLTDCLRQKVRGKLRQAQRQSEHPLLVAVTTLHWNASHACMDRLAVEFAMGSPPHITADLDTRTGDAVGDVYQSTDLKRSVFLSPNLVLNADGIPVVQAKYQPISGFLIGGFGLQPREVRPLGALNPEATRPFDPVILPHIPWCKFREWPATRHISFEWTITEEAERQNEQFERNRRLRRGKHRKLWESIQSELRRSADEHSAN